MGSEGGFPFPSVRGFFGGGGGGSWGSLVLGWVAPGWLAGGVPSLLRSFVFFCVFCVVSVFSFLFFATCLEDSGEGGAPPHVDPLTIASHPDPMASLRLSSKARVAFFSGNLPNAFSSNARMPIGTSNTVDCESSSVEMR